MILNDSECESNITPTQISSLINISQDNNKTTKLPLDRQITNIYTHVK